MANWRSEWKNGRERQVVTKEEFPARLDSPGGSRRVSTEECIPSLVMSYIVSIRVLIYKNMKTKKRSLATFWRQLVGDQGDPHAELEMAGDAMLKVAQAMKLVWELMVQDLIREVKKMEPRRGESGDQARRMGGPRRGSPIGPHNQGHRAHGAEIGCRDSRFDQLLQFLLECGNPASSGIMIRDRRWRVY